MSRVQHLNQTVLSKIDALDAILSALHLRANKPRLLLHQSELQALRTAYIVNAAPILIAASGSIGSTVSTSSPAIPSPMTSSTTVESLTIEDLLNEIITISTQVVYEEPCLKVARPDPEIDEIPDIDKPAVTIVRKKVPVPVATARSAKTRSESKSELMEHYLRLLREVHTMNVRGRMTGIMAWCTRQIDTPTQNMSPIPNINELMRRYEFYTLDDSVEKGTDHICQRCNIPYFLDEKMSEFNCSRCGITEPLYGEVFSDDQIMFHEGARVRNSSYAPTKRCKEWIDRIQARETDSLPEELINSIKILIKRDKVFFENINYKLIRGYLSELKMSKYNDNIPSIKKRITQKDPPQFTDTELRQIHMYFSRVMQILGKINTDKKNCSHHQFFIYKIVEQIMTHPRDHGRRRGILANIHLQSKQTLVRNDEIWAEVCEHIQGFTATTTMPR